MERSLKIKESTMGSIQTKIFYDALITLGLVMILIFLMTASCSSDGYI